MEATNSTLLTEEAVREVRERAATYLTGSVHAELYHQDVTLLLSVIDSRSAFTGETTVSKRRIRFLMLAFIAWLAYFLVGLYDERLLAFLDQQKRGSIEQGIEVGLLLLLAVSLVRGTEKGERDG